MWAENSSGVPAMNFINLESVTPVFGQVFRSLWKQARIIEKRAATPPVTNAKGAKFVAPQSYRHAPFVLVMARFVFIRHHRTA